MIARARYHVIGMEDETGWHTVKVMADKDTTEVINWIERCLKGRWTLDWMYGDERSTPREDRGCTLYIFESIEDATLARTFWG